MIEYNKLKEENIVLKYSITFYEVFDTVETRRKNITKEFEIPDSEHDGVHVPLIERTNYEYLLCLLC